MTPGRGDVLSAVVRVAPWWPGVIGVAHCCFWTKSSTRVGRSSSFSVAAQRLVAAVIYNFGMFCSALRITACPFPGRSSSVSASGSASRNSRAKGRLLSGGSGSALAGPGEGRRSGALRGAADSGWRLAAEPGDDHVRARLVEEVTGVSASHDTTANQEASAKRARRPRQIRTAAPRCSHRPGRRASKLWLRAQSLHNWTGPRTCRAMSS